jgi:hypothetical protein
MKSSFFGLLIVLMFASSCKSYWARQENAWTNIETLKNGALLVRLQTGEKKIAALKKAGLEEKAEEAASYQKQQNEFITQAFVKHFDYCPVYFFYADKSEEIKNGNFEYLMDADLNKLSNSKVNESNWFLAEYALTQDPLSGEKNVKKIPAASKGVKSIVLKNRDFVQLGRPFPYAGRVFNDEEADFYKAVMSVNTSLKEFEIEAQGRKQKRELKQKKKNLNA